MTWRVLSIADNVPGGGAGRTSRTTVPPVPPIPALRSNSIHQTLGLGLYHSCALNRAGGVVCWGDNRFGQIGDGSSDPGPVFTPAAVAGLPDADPPIQIAAGDRHTCALAASGAVYCWGANDSGQLGNDPETLPLSTTAVQVARIGVVFAQLVAGGNQTCALDAHSNAYCWGNNAFGQLGVGTTTNSSVPLPVLVGTVPFEHITTSANHTCAAQGFDEGWGAVWCWGDDSFGQLGNTNAATPLPGTKIFPSPVRVLHVSPGSRPNTLDGLELIQRVASGTNYTCGITIYGNYYCWGDSSLDQLGIVPAPGQGNSYGDFAGDVPMYSSADFGDPPGGTGQITFTAGPVPYTSGSVAYAAPQIVSGSDHVCVLPTGYGGPAGQGHYALCWGSNRSGQLGANAPGDRSGSWVGVAPGDPGETYSELSAGGDHTCAVSSDGDVDCWGDNSYGQLGREGPSTPIAQRVAIGPRVNTAAAPPSSAGTPLVDCRIDPNAGGAPNYGNLASYLFYLRDVFTHPVHVTEVDFEFWSDSATLTNEFTLTLYSYSESSGAYTKLGETTVANIFPWLGSGGVPTVRFVFDGDGVLVPVPAGGGPVPVVLQITQVSGLTLTMGANLISNPGTVECPISASEIVSIPLQIFAR